MLNNLLAFDAQVTDSIYRFFPHLPFTDIFFSFFSQSGSSILIWLLLVAFVMVKEELEDKKFIVFFGLSFGLAFIVSSFILKPIFHRARPASFSQTPASCPKDFSFPSVHAATAFAAAVIFSRFDKKRKYFYYATAGLISLSRIYLHCHYFFDVIFGGLAGYFLSKISLYFFLKTKVNKD